jgi:hypothetical protein
MPHINVLQPPLWLCQFYSWNIWKHMGIQKTILWFQVRMISHNLSKLYFLYVNLLHTELYEIMFMAIVETFNNYALHEVLTAVTGM